jgi:hypothetical protein
MSCISAGQTIGRIRRASMERAKTMSPVLFRDAVMILSYFTEWGVAIFFRPIAPLPCFLPLMEPAKKQQQSPLRRFVFLFRGA